MRIHFKTPRFQKAILAAGFALLFTTSLLAQNNTCPIISVGSVRTCSPSILAISLDWTPLGCPAGPNWFGFPATITYQETDCAGNNIGAAQILNKAPGSCSSTSYFKSGATGCNTANCFNLTLPAPYGNTCMYSVTGVLPIELVSFQGRLAGEGIDLNWVTASELDNDFFVVEKSTDGIRFDEITKIEGRGTISEASDYSFMDKSPVRGTNFYRLKQVDFNGNSSFSDIISVDFRQNGSIFIAPNPASDFAVVTVPESLLDQDATIQVVNLAGQVVYEKAFRIEDSTIKMELNEVAAGLYMVNLRTSQESFVKTLILDK